MMVDVVAVKVLEGHRLWLKFDDGAEGEFDFGLNLGFDGIFAPLQDPQYFALAKVDPDLGSVAWPNGADLDPLVLHAAVTGHAVQVA
ncbi:MAG TPA: DUF2442 domain-containing protein [Polyangiaceae bacterium]